MSTPFQLVFAMCLIFVIQSAPVERQSQCSQQIITKDTLENKKLECFYCAANGVKSSIQKLAKFQNVSIILKKNDNQEVVANDNNCTNTLNYEILTAAMSFKLLLQEYLLNNSGQLDCSDETIQHLTNILVNLTIIANIHQDIQNTSCSVQDSRRFYNLSVEMMHKNPMAITDENEVIVNWVEHDVYNIDDDFNPPDSCSPDVCTLHYI